MLFSKRDQFFNVRTDDLNEKKEKKKEEESTKGKLVTASEGEYIRCYLLKEDGTKILLSETKLSNDDNKLESKPVQPNSNNQEQSASSANTKEMMMLLNLEAGIPFNVLKKVYQAEENEQ